MFLISIILALAKSAIYFSDKDKIRVVFAFVPMLYFRQVRTLCLPIIIKRRKPPCRKLILKTNWSFALRGFKSVLYEKDETFLENMAKSNMDQGNLALLYAVGGGPRGRGPVRPVEAV